VQWATRQTNPIKRRELKDILTTIDDDTNAYFSKGHRMRLNRMRMPNTRRALRLIHVLLAVGAVLAFLCNPHAADAYPAQLECSQCDGSGDLWLYYNTCSTQEKNWPIYVGIDEYNGSAEMGGYPQDVQAASITKCLTAPANSDDSVSGNVTPGFTLIDYSITGEYNPCGCSFSPSRCETSLCCCNIRHHHRCVPYYYYAQTLVPEECCAKAVAADWSMTIQPKQPSGPVAHMTNPYIIPLQITNNSPNRVNLHFLFGEFRTDPSESDDHPTMKGVKGMDTNGNLRIFRRVRSAPGNPNGYTFDIGETRTITDLVVDIGDSQVTGAKQLFLDVRAINTTEKNRIAQRSVNLLP
jgi:hypothetical protein